MAAKKKVLKKGPAGTKVKPVVKDLAPRKGAKGGALRDIEAGTHHLTGGLRDTESGTHHIEGV